MNQNIDNLTEQNVFLFTLTKLRGIKYELSYGNYNNTKLLAKIAPNNIFSLKIPPLTKVRLYGGNSFGYGNIGSIEISNARSNRYMILDNLPINLEGLIRSISVSRIPDTALIANDSAMSNDSAISNNSAISNDRNMGNNMAMKEAFGINTFKCDILYLVYLVITIIGIVLYCFQKLKM